MAVNVVKLNDHLSGNADAIETILSAIGCENIRYNPSKREFRCSREPDKNPTAVRVKIDNLRFSCFSTNEQGSIFNLIMSKKRLSFPEALKWTIKTLGLDKDYFDGIVKLPFGGYYKKIIRSDVEPELNQTVYPEETLDEFGKISHIQFLKDGIDLQTQEKFHLGYDNTTSRITIPQWDLNGNLIGVMGRSNDPEIPYKYRWLPIIPCARSLTLYGYHINYSAIQRQQMAIITESEKGVMQLASMGYNFGLATGTRRISEVQAKYLKALRVDRMIIAYDQGIPEDELRAEAYKIKMDNHIYTNKIGYIFDKSGEILKNDSKDSPTDLGQDKFRVLVNNYTRWI